MQQVHFTEHNLQEAVEFAPHKKTTLLAWFDLNSIDPSARRYTYTEIPYHYVYKTKRITVGINEITVNYWNRRKLRSGKIIPRLYSVSIKDEERFF